MASAKREPIMGAGVQGQSPWSGAKWPEAESSEAVVCPKEGPKRCYQYAKTV